MCRGPHCPPPPRRSREWVGLSQRTLRPTFERSNWTVLGWLNSLSTFGVNQRIYKTKKTRQRTRRPKTGPCSEFNAATFLNITLDSQRKIHLVESTMAGGEEGGKYMFIWAARKLPVIILWDRPGRACTAPVWLYTGYGGAGGLSGGPGGLGGGRGLLASSNCVLAAATLLCPG